MAEEQMRKKKIEIITEPRIRPCRK